MHIRATAIADGYLPPNALADTERARRFDAVISSAHPSINLGIARTVARPAGWVIGNGDLSTFGHQCRLVPARG